jgi:thiamine pyrophosphate-dependent acetolactate synthase large subunit-like protein
MAVALGEMGPGGLNLASGLGVAFNNNLPLLAITTNQHRAASYPHSGMFMDLDTVAVTKPITKWNAVVHDARRMPELVRRAFREALSRPARPGAPGHPAGRAGAAPMQLRRRRVRLAPRHYRATMAARPAPHAVADAIALAAHRAAAAGRRRRRRGGKRRGTAVRELARG